MARHKKQHYVPACYLKAWYDTTAPKNQTPYVWFFDKDSSNARAKAPENIFHETNMYTIITERGKRDLRLEHGLAQLETEFARIRDKKLRRRLPFDQDDHTLLCAFIVAQLFRTPKMREHHRQQWEPVLKKMEHMLEWAKTATPEQKRQLAEMLEPSSESKQSVEYEDVKRIYEQPIQTMMRPAVATLTPLLSRLDMAILEIENDSIGFITSDNPCVMFDPAAYKRPPFYRAPGLAYPTTEITLPVSPRQCICLNQMKLKGYWRVQETHLDEINRRTRFWADKYFVVNCNQIKRIWFDLGKEPEDSWEKLHGQKNNSSGRK